MKRTTLALVGALAITASLNSLASDTYPNKPITLVVPSSPGGSTDTGARIYADALSNALGTPVVVNNKPGAGLTIGSAHVANANPDGYTLLFTINSPISVAKYTFKDLPYDPEKSFAPVSLVGKTLQVIVAAPKFGPSTMQEVINYASSNPGGIRFGTPGVGTPDHLALEMINARANTEIIHVPYQGGSPVVSALLGGVIEMGIASLVTVTQHINTGALKPIALVETQRYAKLPDIPAVDEAIPGVGRPSWFGVFAPAGTPQAVVNKLNDATREILNRPEVANRLTDAGILPESSSPEELQQQVTHDVKYFGDLIQRLGIDLKQ